MKSRTLLLCAAVSILTWLVMGAGAAAAGDDYTTLTSGGLASQGTGGEPLKSTFKCSVINVGNKPITVTITIIDDQGVVLPNSAENPITVILPPGQGDAAETDDQESTAYCKVTGKFKAQNVRALHTVKDNFGSTIAADPCR